MGVRPHSMHLILEFSGEASLKAVIDLSASALFCYQR
jgi:hypothetical protein